MAICHEDEMEIVHLNVLHKYSFSPPPLLVFSCLLGRAPGLCAVADNARARARVFQESGSSPTPASLECLGENELGITVYLKR